MHSEMKQSKLKLDSECYQLLVQIYSQNGMYSDAVLVSTTMKILGLDKEIQPIVEKASMETRYSPGMDLLIAASGSHIPKANNPAPASNIPKIRRSITSLIHVLKKAGRADSLKPLEALVEEFENGKLIFSNHNLFYLMRTCRTRSLVEISNRYHAQLLITR
jgi:hypothetical protein